ncbi:hypothetical protein K4A83_13235 [Spirulina subsalsa FACHB-351]|uniref:Uncharacterized protein n=1 Tax=Spirulina subsalsa FACHB-351 TaxID=234711 RepID=A0ABT3L6T4_9CYAN|nr:hypothetical protein [Spirulina subsalsa]MCW6037226.1 hypothetical protein [Spirulina subsalsa FACHB-351]
MSQVSVFFLFKVPLAALPLQVAALGYVGWYWHRRSRRQYQEVAISSQTGDQQSSPTQQINAKHPNLN